MRWIVDLFSSVTFGIVLLALLFLYSSIGSAGLLWPTGWNILSRENWAYDQIRQWRGLEMTEFEWFHWWPFDLLMLLICTNIVVVTLRRIPLRPVNYGVWMIHSGILVLSIGSVWYFGTKIEGDAVVVRRDVVIEVPGARAARVPAVPGNRLSVPTPDGHWGFTISQIDPAWSIRSGDDEGEQAYSVNVSVERPDGTSFIRQVLAGFPEYTEDIVRSDDPSGPPMARAIKTIGRKLLDEDLAISLDYSPQHYVYLANHISKSWALYVREKGERDWKQRPVDGLPLYNDYVGSPDAVWLEPGEDLPIDPIDVAAAPLEPTDPLPAHDLRISSYLRYAFLEARREAGGTALDPYVRVSISSGGDRFARELLAFDPARTTDEAGMLRFAWADSEEQRRAFAEMREPVLHLAVPEAGVDVELPIRSSLNLDPDLPFEPIPGTDLSWRVEFMERELELPGARTGALVSVQLRTPDQIFRRWVFEDERYTVDLDLREEAEASLAETGHGPDDGHDHGAMIDHDFRAPDPSIVTTFDAGMQPAPMTLVAGPDEHELWLLTSLMGGAGGDWRRVSPGESVTVLETDDHRIDLEVEAYLPRSRVSVRPAVVPRAQRERDARETFSMVRVHAPSELGGGSVWVPFSRYPVRDPNETLRRFAYQPTELTLADGRTLELVLSRERLVLPAPMVLEDFDLITHVGGFTSSTLSVRDWRSWVRFATDEGLTEPLAASMNKPGAHAGLWYFQAEWDPPSPSRRAGEPPSAGLNYTVLGIGNRNGVGIQLLGCCIAVLGMVYAFYVKPYLRRRAREAPLTTPEVA